MLPHAQLPDLPAELEQLLSQVPAGKITTYGDLAVALGDVAASRWIGTYLLHDESTHDWPTHRVVRSDGSLGLYAHGDASAKAARLSAEDVAVTDGKVNLDRSGVRKFRTNRPLEALRRMQNRLPEQCVIEPNT